MRIFKHPIKKLTFLTAFSGGYVLGARAGRERYEQILQVVGQVKNDPRVHETATQAHDVLRDTAPSVSDATGSSDDNDGPSHPLPADEHVGAEDEVVYSTGPDIEETVDELAPDNDAERV